MKIRWDYFAVEKVRKTFCLFFLHLQKIKLSFTVVLINWCLTKQTSEIFSMFLAPFAQREYPSTGGKDQGKEH
jgi:hypothetical protein